MVPGYKYPKDPKTNIWKILEWIQSNRDGEIFASGIVDAFGLTPSDAAHRLRKLKEYKVLAYINRQTGARDGYELTPYGKKFDTSVISDKYTKKKRRKDNDRIDK